MPVTAKCCRYTIGLKDKMEMTKYGDLRDINEKPFNLSISLEDSVRWFTGLCKEMVVRGQLFNDPFFPASAKSISSSKVIPKHVIWKRPAEMVSNPYFTKKGVERFDVRLGRLSEVSIVNAMAFLFMHNVLLKHVVPENQTFDEELYAGMFLFRFWQYGDWIDVVVDDQLPIKNDERQYMHSDHEDEFWPSLLEKAYAKVHGSYEYLKGVSNAMVMEDFTGGMYETVDLLAYKQQQDKLYDIISKAQRRKSLIGCFLHDETYISESRGPKGIINEHFYSITGRDNVDVNGRGLVGLLRIRNPWGNESEWTGEFCDGSHVWDKVSPKDRKHFDTANLADGEFWMAFEDLCRYFTNLEICHFSPESNCANIYKDSKRRWSYLRIDSEWQKFVSAGGSRNNMYAFAMNPQYCIELTEPDDGDDDGKGTLILGVMQKGVRRKCIDGGHLFSIGYAIYKVPEKDKECPLDKNFFETTPCTFASEFITGREVSGRHRFLPGCYVIIPSTFNPSEEARFLLRIFAEKQITVTETNNESCIKAVEPINGLSTEEETKMTKLFHSVTGSDNAIDANDLRTLVNDYFKKDLRSEKLELETARSLLAMVDSCCSGKLTLKEFRCLWMELQFWKSIYKKFRTDSNGSMDAMVMRQCFNSLGIRINKCCFRSLVTRYVHKNGMINFSDFIHLLSRVKTSFAIWDKAHSTTQPNVALFERDEFLGHVFYV